MCWVGMVLSLSRGPVLFCAVASLIYLLFVLRSQVSSFGRYKKFVVIVLIAAMVPTVIGQLLSVEANRVRFTRMFNIQAELQEGGRGNVWRMSIEEINRSPLIGNGLGSYIADGATPHNVFLQYGEDSGLVGMLTMAVFFLVISSRVIKIIPYGQSKNHQYGFSWWRIYFFI